MLSCPGALNAKTNSIIGGTDAGDTQGHQVCVIEGLEYTFLIL